jgi:tetratricopeptide (TPR) repeat protein
MLSPAPRVLQPDRFRVSRPALVWAAATIVAATLAAYAGSFRGVFVFDDRGTLVDNPTLHSWWAALFPPNNGIPVAGRPIANLSFAINRTLTGNQPWGYHLGNLLIHLGAVLALFGVVRRTLMRGVAGVPREAALPLAWAIALLWAVHPLQTEAVTYLSQRVESLMGLFYLLTLYAFIRAADASTDGAGGTRSGMVTPPDGSGALAGSLRQSGRRWTWLCVGCCLLGMGTKEVMVTAPVMLFLYDCTFLSAGPAAAWRARKGTYLAVAATWAPLAFLVITTGTRGGTAGFGSEVSWLAYGFTQIRAVALYLRLAVWPNPLIADYGRTLGGPRAEMLADFVLLAAFAGLTVRGLWRRSPWGFLGAWFLVILTPSSSVVPVSTEFIAERRVYLSLAAVVTAAVVGLYAAVQSVARGRRWPAGRAWWVGGAVVTMLAGALAATTVQRNTVYRSVLSFWGDVVGKLPDNAGARNNFGNALAENGNFAAAEAQYRESLRLVPGYATAHYDLGNALVSLGRPDEAIEHYEIALATPSMQAVASHALGVAAYRVANALLDRGKPAAAAEYYRQAVTLRPDLVDAHVNYGGVLMVLDRPWEAANELRAAAKLDPRSADIHNDLGGILAQSGQWPEAEKEFEEALRLKPDYPAARDNLERVRRMQGGAPPS